jgi:hypothetical protein
VTNWNQNLPLDRKLSDSILLLIPISERARMRRVKIKEWLEIVGMAAIVASLLFVGLQIRQDHKIALMESAGSDSSINAQLADLLQGNGELWRKSLDGEELSKAEQIEFYTMARAVEYIYISSWRRATLLDEGGGFSADAAIRDYSIAIYFHVGLRRHFDARIARVTRNDMAFDVPVEIGPFDRSIIKRLEYLAANPMPIPENKDYMFW